MFVNTTQNVIGIILLIMVIITTTNTTTINIVTLVTAVLLPWLVVIFVQNLLLITWSSRGRKITILVLWQFSITVVIIVWRCIAAVFTSIITLSCRCYIVFSGCVGITFTLNTWSIFWFVLHNYGVMHDNGSTD